MPRPFAYVAFLILATAHKSFPFMLLDTGGVRGYFVTREDAEAFISMEVQS